MYKLSSFFEAVYHDGLFLQTQFANTGMPQSLCYVAKEQYLHQANDNSNVVCIVVPESLASNVGSGKGVVIARNAEQTFYQLHNELFSQHNMRPKMDFYRSENVYIHPSAIVSERTHIGSNVHIGAGVIVEDYVHISDDVRIESGAILGSSGHYYKRYDNKLFRVEHAGGVWIEQGVQVLAGAVVSKSLHPDFTTIGEETVVSIQAHIGHGCKVGKRCTLTGGVQVSGFTTIGDDVWAGPSATIGNLRTIANATRIETGSVVIKDTLKGEHVSGNFAVNHRSNIRAYTKMLRGKS